MSVVVKCSHCATSYKLDASLLGKKLRCKKCGNAFVATNSASGASPKPGAGSGAGAAPAQTPAPFVAKRAPEPAPSSEPANPLMDVLGSLDPGASSGAGSSGGASGAGFGAAPLAPAKLPGSGVKSKRSGGGGGLDTGKIVAVGFIVLLLIGGVVLAVMFSGGEDKPTPPVAANGGDAGQPTGGNASATLARGPRKVVTLQNRLVNLRGTSGASNQSGASGNNGGGNSGANPSGGDTKVTESPSNPTNTNTQSFPPAKDGIYQIPGGIPVLFGNRIVLTRSPARVTVRGGQISVTGGHGTSMVSVSSDAGKKYLARGVRRLDPIAPLPTASVTKGPGVKIGGPGDGPTDSNPGGNLGGKVGVFSQPEVTDADGGDLPYKLKVSTSNWTVKPDPWDVEPKPLPAKADWSMPLDRVRDLTYPDTPWPRYVAGGYGSSSSSPLVVVALPSRRPVGSLTKLPYSSADDRFLSGDGRFIAIKARRPATKTSKSAVVLGVFNVRTGKLYREITLDGEIRWAGFFNEFFLGILTRRAPGVGNSRMVLRTIDLRKGAQVSEMAVPPISGIYSYLQQSPNGRYLFAIERSTNIPEETRGKLFAFDLVEGVASGAITLAKEDVRGGSIYFRGIATSPDGRRIAVLSNLSSVSVLTILDAQSGRLLLNRRVDSDGLNSVMYSSYRGKAVHYSPDGEYLLVYGRFIVSGTSGATLGTLRLASRNSLTRHRPVHFIDNGRVVFVGSDTSGQSKYHLYSEIIDREQLAKAEKVIASGGRSDEAHLPPSKKVSASGANEMVLGDGAPWTYQPNMPAVETRSGRWSFRSPDKHIKSVHVSGDGTRAVAVGVDMEPNLLRGGQAAMWWVEATSIKGGGAPQLVGMLKGMEPIAVNTAGQAVLTRLGGREQRLDLVKLDGKKAIHLVGWEPFANEPVPRTSEYASDSSRARALKSTRGVEGAWFIDDSHVLTVNQNKTRMTLWQVPACRAVWTMAPKASVIKLSPSGKTLAMVVSRTVFLVDAMTGKTLGAMPATNAQSYMTHSQLAFNADGTRLIGMNTSNYGTLAVWDLTNGRLLDDGSLGLSGPAIQRTTSPDHVLLGNKLLDLRLMTHVWEYDLSGLLTNVTVHAGPDARTFALRSGASGAVLLAVACPDKRVASELAQIHDGATPVLQSGAAASLNVRMQGGSTYNKQVTDALTERLTSMGAKVGGGQVRVEASSSIRNTGKTHKYVLRKGIIPPIFNQVRPGDKVINIAEREMTVTLRVLDPSGQSVFARVFKSRRGSGESLRLQEGQNANTLINEALYSSAVSRVRGIDFPAVIYRLPKRGKSTLFDN